MRNITAVSKAICCAGLALLSSSCRCVAPSRLDSSSAGESEGGVRQMAASIARDISAEGPNAWLRYFTGDRDFFMANDGSMQFSTLEDAKTFLNKFSVGVAHLELTWGEIRVDAIAPGVAVMASPYHEVITSASGSVSRFDGYFTGLAIETKTGWKLRDAHWSSPAGSQ
jgi:hypothetical protein